MKPICSLEKNNMDFPMQESGSLRLAPQHNSGCFDMRDWLHPRRLTLVMWDQAYLMRHFQGQSYADYDRVLDETIERGYNTLRLDPLPQLIDLARAENVYRWEDPKTPYMPWGWDRAGEGPLGTFLIDFMEKVQRRQMHYTLSTWWITDVSSNNPFPMGSKSPRTHMEAADLWAVMLREWQRRFGFEGLVYVDIANEVPYFLPGFMRRIEDETGRGWGEAAFSSRQVEFLSLELNTAMSALQREFPQLRFTASIHGDERWLEVPLNFDCLDVHFYSDADMRWRDRTGFGDVMDKLFTDSSWHKGFSERCKQTRDAVAPMLRARQRSKLSAFAAWSKQQGMPLTTSESWSSWYYFDSPDLDWGWLLEWAEWSVEDAIEYGMWGWTPHNYCQPQFKNWQDVSWHRRLTDRFLRS
jgi:hypothetical protein